MSTSYNPPNQQQKVHGAYSKAQMYGSSIPTYRLRAPIRKRRNNSCCLCCFCLIVLLIALVFLVGLVGFVFWVIYRPKLPKVSVTSVLIPKFDITKSSHLSSEFIVNLTVRNPNKKVSFLYNDSPVKVSSGDLELAKGFIPGFFNGKKNTTVVTADLQSQNVALSASDARKLRDSVESSGEIILDVELVTHVGVKISKWKSPKLRIQVNCNGVAALISSTKTASGSSANSNPKCKFKVRIKVFRWYL